MTRQLAHAEYSATVSLAETDQISVITLNNPPVNGLGDTVRAGVAAALEAAAATPSDAIVLVGDGKGFSGGADVRQFGTEAATAKPDLASVIEQIQKIPKPVIAAINGFALGGGLELALACHYRIAEHESKIGLTEVNLGLIPGAGGTQRLPRLVGLRPAIDLITAGARVSGRQAAEIGIVDESFSGDTLEAAIDFVRRVASQAGELPLIDARPSPDSTGIDFDQIRASVSAGAPNALAQRTAIDCIEASTTHTAADGLVFERQRFLGLLDGPESKLLREQFLAGKR